MIDRRVTKHVGIAVLALLGTASAALAQQANVSVRVTPLGSRSVTPLFTVQIVDEPSRKGMGLPSMTLTNTTGGPEITNLSLDLPPVTFGQSAMTPRIGDQQLPATFLTSPLSGESVHWQMRGLSVSSSGSSPWTFSIGQLDAGQDSWMLTSAAPTVMAMAVRLAPHSRIQVSPRVLVPVGAGKGWQTVIGTAVRAEVMPHLSVVSDVGAAGDPRAGWAPLASAGVVGHWDSTEIETSVVRSARSGARAASTVSSEDREIVRGRYRPIEGLTLAAAVSRSRPASVPDGRETQLGSVGVVYDTRLYGRLAATHERRMTSMRTSDSTRVEWRHGLFGGLTVRYVGTRDVRRSEGCCQSRTRLELELPSLTPLPDGRLRVRAALSATRSAPSTAVSSRMSGRFDLSEGLAITGETELDLVRPDDGPALRTARLATEVEVLPDTGVQLGYAYRAGVPFSLAKNLEVRVSRTIDLSLR